jgi:hypothetical protein
MTILAVTFNGTRLADSDTNTGWGNFQPSTGGAPSSEGANAYQISSGAAANTGVVGRQSQSSVTRRGVDHNGATVDFTATANRLMYLKGYVTDFSDLNATFGVEFAMGTADTDLYHSYNMAGSGAALPVYSQYPPQGGYLITCIDPTIDAWADTADVGGTFDQADVTWYAFGAQMIAGNSKSENVAFDAIDYGTGLTLLSGDGANDPGDYISFVIADQNDPDKRWGAAIGSGNSAVLRGVMTIGSAGTATEFLDVGSIVTFPDGYHSRGLFGVLFDIGNASSIMADGATLIGAGTRNGVDANDTRPDYEVTGTSGSFIFTGQLRNFRDVEFTSVCDIDGASIECMLLIQGTAEIQNSTILTNALISIACLQDPTFGTTTDLHDTDFIQAGAGHALEIDSLGTYTFTNLTFTGYGADTTDDAAIDVTHAGPGTVTINYSGSAPTFKTAGATVVLVGNPVATKITIEEADGTKIENARVFIETADDGGGTGFPFEAGIATLVQVAGTATLTSDDPHGLQDDDYIVVRESTSQHYNRTAQVTVTGASELEYAVDSGAAATALGTPVFSYMPLSGLTDVNGEITSSRSWPAAQSLKGWARKSTASPLFQQTAISILDASGGTDLLVALQSDE